MVLQGLISNPDKNTNRKKKKKTYRPIFTMNIDRKILNKIAPSQNE